ncbi:E3 ubiquitin- ligase TRIM39-like protein [Labeo rohita]|uniref:E3 ubiquitin-ligase TRIM39-like protein n=1 Tax=Labeo rohita TaxID=84645 RepID=A0A498N0G2_LABRO|nr:E3 ubiquitin- ligase TRIM39-like protein [Labeo rohita]
MSVLFSKLLNHHLRISVYIRFSDIFSPIVTTYFTPAGKGCHLGNSLYLQDLNKLEVFQMRCLRQILQVSLRDRISNNEIRHRCHDQPSIDEQIQRRQLRWFGHVCRMSDHRLPHRLLWRQCPDHWRIRRDAPKKIWVKQIEHDLKSRRLNFEQAKTVATDRQAWKKIVGEIDTPAAPTAVYWLRGRPSPPTAS